MKKHIVIFSHGFGVSKDDRGLFTDIAGYFPNIEAVLFDYNEYDEGSSALLVRPFSEQARILEQTIKDVRRENPDAVVDLLCHSQGCIIAGLIETEGLRRIILLAPPVATGIEGMIKMFGSRPGAIVDLEGTSSFPRRDGSTTLVPRQYWVERQSTVPMDLYNELRPLEEVVLVKATRDEVLGDTDLSGINPAVHIIEIDSRHDFTGEVRGRLLSVLSVYLE